MVHTNSPSSVPADKGQLVVTVNDVHVKGTPLEVIVCYPSGIIREIQDHNIKRRFGALSFTMSGLLFAADSEKNEICIFDTTGSILRTVELGRDVGSENVILLVLSNYKMATLQSAFLVTTVSTSTLQRGDFMKFIQYRLTKRVKLKNLNRMFWITLPE